MISVKDGIVFKDYQKIAVKFICTRNASLISLKTGTGKSLIALKSATYLVNKGKVDKAIILGTKASVSEIVGDALDKLRKDGKPYNLTVIKDDTDLVNFYGSDNKIAIIQYEALHKITLTKFARLMTSHRTAVFADESHRLKNPKALISSTVKALRRYISVLVFLTATPITNNIADLYYQIHMLNTAVFKSKRLFDNTFLVKKMETNYKTKAKYPVVVSYKNMELLRTLIGPVCYSYYPEQDVEYIEHRVELDNVDDYVKAAEGVCGEKDYKLHSARLVDLQHVVDKSKNKISKYLEVIKPLLKDGLITYCHFHETIAVISEELDNLGVDYKVISGKITSSKKRTEIKNWFNSNPANKILIITSAGAQSMNLQSVNNLIFYNIPFGFGAFTQAKGRIERLFSKFSNFKIHFILTEIVKPKKVIGTVDVYKFELVSSYGELTSTVLHANETPQGNLKSFNSKLITKLKRCMLWLK